jgi:hypothetical protein
MSTQSLFVMSAFSHIGPHGSLAPRHRSQDHHRYEAIARAAAWRRQRLGELKARWIGSLNPA